MRQLDHAVIIAVLLIRVMKMAAHDVINMIAVWNCFVATIRAVPVCTIMTAAIMLGCTFVGVLGSGLYAVFINVVFMNEMQMAVMQIIDMSIVANRRMATSLLVLMVVTFVDEMILRHSFSVGMLAPVCKRNLTAQSTDLPVHGFK